MRDRENLLQEVFDTLSTGIFVVEVESLGSTKPEARTFRFLTNNPAYARMLSLSQANLSGLCPHECFPISNLLLNAIKYSPQGTIVQFDLACDQSNVVVRIQDEGIGIPLEDQQHLFESFYRGSNVGTISGTGLGLAIVKSCVTLHGGHIAVVSEVGVGTTFTVTLPLNNRVTTDDKASDTQGL